MSTQPICPHCGAAVSYTHLVVWYSCGTSVAEINGTLRHKNCYESELAAIREQLEQVTKERDEARAKFGAFIRRTDFGSYPWNLEREAALTLFDKLEGGAS